MLDTERTMNAPNTTQTASLNETVKPSLISDAQFRLFQLFVYVILIGSVSLFGVASNLLNVVVFIRMGLMSDSSNVSLFGLAISDFGSVTSLVSFSVLTTLQLLDPPDLNWHLDSVMYMAAGWPHIIFVQLTCWITAYIALERCVCVVFPFKVKTWFSPQRSLKVIIGIKLYFLISYLPLFVTRTLQWRLDSATNTTRLIAVTSPHFHMFRNVIPYVNIFVSSAASLLIVFICTKITTSRVKSSSQWRRKVTASVHVATQSSSGNAQPVGNPKDTNGQHPATTVSNQKEMKLIKMITTICIVFMVCNLPGVVNPYIRQGFPEIDHGTRYHNLFHVMYGCCFLLESINSSINIFIYYRLSTRYRQELRRIFRLSL